MLTAQLAVPRRGQGRPRFHVFDPEGDEEVSPAEDGRRRVGIAISARSRLGYDATDRRDWHHRFMIAPLLEQKALPHSEESERAVLAAILLDPSRHLPTTSGGLRPNDFYRRSR